jgi:hypothetical protein
MGRFDEAIQAHTQAAAVFRELGDHHSEAQALNDLSKAQPHEDRRWWRRRR